MILKGPRDALGLSADTQLIETLAHFPRERIPERYPYLPHSPQIL